jgi:hypothetical protein
VNDAIATGLHGTHQDPATTRLDKLNVLLHIFVCMDGRDEHPFREAPRTLNRRTNRSTSALDFVERDGDWHVILKMAMAVETSFNDHLWVCDRSSMFDITTFEEPRSEHMAHIFTKYIEETVTLRGDTSLTAEDQETCARKTMLHSFDFVLHCVLSHAIPAFMFLARRDHVKEQPDIEWILGPVEVLCQ